MARGWESKSIEAQQQDAAAAPKKSSNAPLTAEERARMQRRRTLELARARTVSDLARSSSPVHRAMLEQALRAIDEQIQHLG